MKLPSNQRTCAVALEGQDVGRDPVEEPAVVADDHGAAGEGLQAGLERPERVDVEVVGRLVEQQHVAARLEQLGQVDAVPLAAGQLADRLLLVGAPEVEARHVGAGRDLALPDLDELVAARVISSKTVRSAWRSSRLWST